MRAAPMRASPTRTAPFGTALVAVAVLGLAACGGAATVEAPVSEAPGPTEAGAEDIGGAAQAPDETSAAPVAPEPAAPTEPVARVPVADAVTGVPDVAGLTDVATDLEVPWDLTFLPDGDSLVTLRDAARVLRVSADGTVTPVVADGDDGRVADVEPGGEGGLLGITTDATADHVFVYLSAAQENRVVRYDLAPDATTMTGPVAVVTGIPRFSSHNGGRIDIGPDGHLYVATGDAQDRSTPPDPSTLAGKILRVTTDGDPAPGNPDPGSAVWTLGHRNVQGLGWSADGTMWASEFGQDTTDELNVIRAGEDYGWPEVEGVGGVEGLRDPVVTWSPDEASPSGIVVADDAVYVAALRGQRLWRVPVSEGAVSGEPEAFLQEELGRIRHVEAAPDGSLWLLTDNVGRGRGSAGDDRVVRLPVG